jgi:Transmembrane protein 43
MRRSGAGFRMLIVVGLVAAVLGAIWLARRYESRVDHHVDVADTSGSLTSDARKVTLSGKLEIAKPPHDVQLGVTAPAATLLRHVEVFQWQEHCDTGGCHYEKGWFGGTIDSTNFRERAGHDNPKAPFSDAKFSAGDVKLNGLQVDPELIAQLVPADFPIRAADLPPNLAATFRVQDGVLYAGGDIAHPQVGELRVSYRAAGAGDVELSGWQRASKLAAH